MIQQQRPLKFSAPQRELVFKALGEAEERTSGYYCIPPFRWEQLRYDLLTREDHGWEAIPDSMLARVRLLERTGAQKSFDFYRIELNDPSILSAAARENLLQSSELYPFLVYILTHEMVHMVRLSTIIDNHTAAAAAPDQAEENRVQDVAHRILSGYSRLLPVLRKFCSRESSPHPLGIPEDLR